MELSDKQQQYLAEFKTRTQHLEIPEHLQNDSDMVKWLIARKFNVDKATAMLTRSLEWRKKWNIDTIDNWEPPEVLKKYSPAGHCGFSKEGAPVWITNSGKIDIRGILHSASKKDYLHYNVKILEYGCRYLNQQTKDTRKCPIFRQILIIDLDQYTFDQATWKPGLDATKDLTIMYEANYPEMLQKCYIINAPKIFTVVFAALKPLLDEDTLNKAKIFGATGWKEALLEDIPADQLPVHYGGTMTDPDGNPMCLSKICYGGPVPTSYYKKKHQKGEKLPEGYETAVIGSREKKTIFIDIDEPYSTLSWTIETENFDIGFGVVRIKDHKQEWLIDEERINSQLTPEEGSITCIDPGSYAIILNNDFSYFRSKTVHFKISVQSVEDNQNPISLNGIKTEDNNYI